MQLKSGLYLILFFLPGGLSGQELCDTLPKRIESKYQDYTKKQFEKLKHKRNLDKYEAYDVAEFLRHKNDSTYTQWYLIFTTGLQKMLQGPTMCYRGECFLFKAAKSYYYLGDLKQADRYLLRARVFDDQQACLDYYCDLIGGPTCK